MYKEEHGLLPIRSHKLIENITSDHIKRLLQYEELNRNKNKYLLGISAVIKVSTCDQENIHRVSHVYGREYVFKMSSDKMYEVILTANMNFRSLNKI
jgi:hypothetical protein